MGFFTNLLNSELGGTKTASKADDTSSPGDATTIGEDMKGKKSEPFGGKKAPPFGSKKEAATMSKDEMLYKIATDTLATKKFIDKVANVLREDAGVDDESLYRNCASAVVHLKLAGRIKPEFDTPKAIAEMAYHLYEDILSNG